MLRLLARMWLLALLAGGAVVLWWGPSRLPMPVWVVLLAGLVVLLAPAGIILVLRWLNPPTTAFMRWARGVLRRAGKPGDLEQVWVSDSDLPPHLRLAAIAGEDMYFARHSGFDWDSLRAAMAHNRAGGAVRGASTITQQVAKNLFLSPTQSVWRKAAEAYLALLIEALWPKRRILEVYLNIAQFGPRVFGAEAGARASFGKAARDLTPQEAALLAAILPNPYDYRADQPSHLVRYRQVMILATMKKMGSGYLARLDARPAGARP